jgi:hypothetical protein
MSKELKSAATQSVNLKAVNNTWKHLFYEIIYFPSWLTAVEIYLHIRQA